MSLSRILNDDPPPLRFTLDADARAPVTPDDSLAHRPRPESTAFWDAARSEPSPDEYVPRQHTVERVGSPTPPGPADEDHNSSKKRRDADAEYQPAKQKRQRKSTRKGKETRPSSPPHDADPGPHLPEQDSSSDLDACEQIWTDELSDYISETRKRQEHVTRYFWGTVLERNTNTKLLLSRHYSTKIESIPEPPQTPPALPAHSYEDDFESIGHKSNGQPHDHRRFNASAEDAALEFEREMLASPKFKGKPDKKRPIPMGGSDSEDDADKSRSKLDPSSKKRKLDGNANGVDTPEDAGGIKPIKLKGKGRQLVREASQDSLSVAPKSSRKRPSIKKKVGLALEIDNATSSRPASLMGDVTPVASRHTSPNPMSTTNVFELDEEVPPMRKAKKVDDSALVKRVKSLEESQRKVWTNIARRDVVKVYKFHTQGFAARQTQQDRIAKLASTQARKPFTKTAKANKDSQAKARRLMREMQVFWKKNEKEERDVRKREHKEAMDRLKVEEEKREAARQARKLEFLISQTELYSHFVGSKLKTTEIEGDTEAAAAAAPAGAFVEDLATGEPLPDIDFDDEDQTNLHRHARFHAREAIELAKQRASAFDQQAALGRQATEGMAAAKGQSGTRQTGEEEETEGATNKPPLVDLDSDELNFQNPTSLMGPLTIAQPKMLVAQLKEYQLKGLNWLATLYEQGINGILADEMGLGKTVQSISLLAYLAETHDIWGPFLVVAPASTLHNWQQELTRFVPKLKALPYWGNVKDRTTLRKFWSKKEISYNQDAPFHVLITSYQLITQDQQYFQRVKWQYMILDEAQNIKNSASVRWKTLLGFQCRNRLLLTGTPIQNSMQELWALLHFIMPSLFDSHDEFNEWFSKDIETAAENKGSKLNERQLRRLHMILKPFMLRRVKRHVQNELSEKIEKEIYVDLSARQRSLYAALLSNVSVQDLIEKASNLGDADSARSLMNLVMQFRKVCNHPELFERADVIAPFSFCKFGRPQAPSREGDYILLPYSTRNPIERSLPLLMYQDGGLLNVPNEHYTSPSQSSSLSKFSIWSTDWIQKSIDAGNNSFGFLRLINLSSSDAHNIHVSPLFRRQFLPPDRDSVYYSSEPDFVASCTANPYRILQHPPLSPRPLIEELPAPGSIATDAWQASCLSRPAMKWYAPTVVAPPISLSCNDRVFTDTQSTLRESPLEALAFYGLPYHLRNHASACLTFQRLLPSIPPIGLAASSPVSQLPQSNMAIPEAKRLIYDSAKLACLDRLLQELKAGDHKVLIYFQMTRMMDLMEEYLIYRQYKYLRLDGSSKLEDRRDMVIDWQTRPDIFVFILSTRAGGLGINLTAADTVIFYDHDWNPSNDAQAMDRAHRLGQTRQVTVYRLITKGTIDERIVQLARVKKDVQDIVVGNKTIADAKPSEIVSLLLNDEQLASYEGSSRFSNDKANGQASQDAMKDLWIEEGDDFFGASVNANNAERPDEDGQAAVAQGGKGKRRKPTAPATGRKKGGGKKKCNDDANGFEE